MLCCLQYLSCQAMLGSVQVPGHPVVCHPAQECCSWRLSTWGKQQYPLLHRVLREAGAQAQHPGASLLHQTPSCRHTPATMPASAQLTWPCCATSWAAAPLAGGSAAPPMMAAASRSSASPASLLPLRAGAWPSWEAAVDPSFDDGLSGPCCKGPAPGAELGLLWEGFSMPGSGSGACNLRLATSGSWTAGSADAG